VLREAILIATW